MTPDEVVKVLEGMLDGKYPISNVVGNDKSEIVKALSSAITFLQDYQKLRERVSVEKIDKIIDKIMPCTCLEDYKKET